MLTHAIFAFISRKANVTASVGVPNVRGHRFLMHMGRLLMGLIGSLVLLFSSPGLPPPGAST